ncbi:hypothetical protein TWF481_006782 [Arthrobotrys musiformis]|uniref:Uncharacterized protein n=1 Tax=Arthrobotrys musiformis TaxID=47236 RepID=A0AAV9WBE5_9PEZI
MLFKNIIHFMNLSVSLAGSIIKPRDANVEELLIGLSRWGGTYTKNAWFIGNQHFSSDEEFNRGQPWIWISTVDVMNKIGGEISIYADAFRDFWEESPISEEEGQELAKKFRALCEKQCQFFGKLVTLRAGLKDFENLPKFFQLRKNMEASLGKAEGAQTELYVSIEEAITANKTGTHTSILLNLSEGYDKFGDSIAPATSAWADRPDPTVCTRAV